MAIIRPSSIVGAISGNLGGVNFAQGGTGAYARQRIRKRPFKANRQHSIQTKYQMLRHAWQDLTDAQRQAWRQAATEHHHVNRFGLPKNLSGAQFFISHNTRGWYLPDIFPKKFDENPPSVSAPAPYPATAFVVTSGGSKIPSIVIPAGSPSTIAYFYGAHTSSTSPRKSWYDFKLMLRTPFVPTSGTWEPDLAPFWDEFIGDPQVGEQCWLQWFTSSGDSVGGPNNQISTFAI